jgi:hypothetical protein
VSLDRPTEINYVDLADALGGALDVEKQALERARMVEALGIQSTRARLEAVVGTYTDWLHVEDVGPLYATLGAVAARNLPGDPVWLILIGAPSSGKTEIVLALKHVEGVKLVSTITVGGLLSGTARRERGSDATGGLLDGLDSGLLLLKDFTSVLSLHHDTRVALLAAFREIYDGSWVRHVGVDGGRELAWEGKLGFVAASTGIIDSHHAVMSQMGERFVLCRLLAATRGLVSRAALRQEGRESEQRARLALLVQELLDGDLPPPQARTEAETDWIADLADFVSLARSAVVRDGNTKAIELVLDPEAPGRLVKQLDGLLQGLSVIGLERGKALRVVARIASDCLPPLRLAVLRQLAGADGFVSTSKLGEALRLPTTSTRNVLEELTPRGIVSRQTQGEGKADLWSITNEGRDGLGLFYPAQNAHGQLPSLHRHVGASDHGSTEFSGWAAPHPEKSEEGSS